MPSWRALLGLDAPAIGHAEKVVSAFGALLGIGLVMAVNSLFLGVAENFSVVASIGAASVLLFAVPHGALSQPWPLLGGQTISALIGVFCYQEMGSLYFAAPCAVGFSILAMHYLRCLHPPGGATAILAVMGGEKIHQLGYYFAFQPVLIDTLIILAAAVALNYPFARRRYPAALAKKKAAPNENLDFALKKMGLFVDVSDEDLAEIYELAKSHEKASRTNLGGNEKC